MGEGDAAGPSQSIDMLLKSKCTFVTLTRTNILPDLSTSPAICKCLLHVIYDARSNAGSKQYPILVLPQAFTRDEIAFNASRPSRTSSCKPFSVLLYTAHPIFTAAIDLYSL